MSTYSNNNIDGMAVGLLLAYVNSSSLLEGKEWHLKWTQVI